jgi:beta-fructofuranosidase
MPPLRELVLDVTRSSTGSDVLNRESQRCHVRHPARGPLELHVFIDRSVVEVFVNDGRCDLAKRIYPARHDSVGVHVFAIGGSATLRSLDAWQIGAVWPLGGDES